MLNLQYPQTATAGNTSGRWTAKYFFTKVTIKDVDRMPRRLGSLSFWVSFDRESSIREVVRGGAPLTW